MKSLMLTLFASATIVSGAITHKNHEEDQRITPQEAEKSAVMVYELTPYFSAPIYEDGSYRVEWEGEEGVLYAIAVVGDCKSAPQLVTDEHEVNLEVVCQ